MSWVVELFRRRANRPARVRFTPDVISAGGGVFRDLFGDYPGDEKVRADYIVKALGAAQLHAVTKAQAGETFELRVVDPIIAESNTLAIARQIAELAYTFGLEAELPVDGTIRLRRMS